MNRELPFRLLAITSAYHPDWAEPVRAVAEAGRGEVAILLRDPNLPRAALARWAERMLPICRAAGARLLVHRSPEVAHQVGADGVHLPEQGVTVAAARAIVGEALVGASRHDGAGVRSAAGADYATLSPVFSSPDKGPPLGTAALETICRTAPVPVVALGGITPERAHLCRLAGAAAVAAIRAVWQGDPAENVQRLLGIGDP